MAHKRACRNPADADDPAVTCAENESPSFCMKIYEGDKICGHLGRSYLSSALVFSKGRSIKVTSRSPEDSLEQRAETPGPRYATVQISAQIRRLILSTTPVAFEIQEINAVNVSSC